MKSSRLKVGRIDYLNIWPLFESIKTSALIKDMDFIPGHPSYLNSALAEKSIDLSPSSSFEYLARAESYRLLPGLGISAVHEVQSVLFCVPFPVDHLADYVAQGGAIRLSRASAASVALLKVLWTFYWQLPEPVWSVREPGEMDFQTPFLEIGNHALDIYLNHPPEVNILDLAVEWKKFTGLPFVFALWIVNEQALLSRLKIIKKLHKALVQARETLPDRFEQLAAQYPAQNMSVQDIICYWKKLDFSLGHAHKAGLALFGRYLTRLGMIPGMPVLDFMDV
ncbi:MAG: menaquinone biosynthetic enzyme MqnA/MqnD family protein [Desulfonatronovibrionaceae bacterium]